MAVLVAMARRASSRPLPPLDPAILRLVEALADAAAERDHRAALALDGGGSVKAKRQR
jgi:hypothetical protein